MNVTPSAPSIDSTGKVVTLTVPKVSATNTDQSVVYNVSYKNGVVASTAFQVAASVVTTVTVAPISVEENHTATPAVTVLDQNGNIITTGYTLGYSMSSNSSTIAADGTITGAAFSSTSANNVSTLTVTATPTSGSVVTGTALVTVTQDLTPPTASIVAPNLAVTAVAEQPSAWNLAVGATPNANIGSVSVNFNETIKKSNVSDIALRVYNGTKDVTPADTTTIKNLLFNKLGSGPANVLSGDINITYSSLKSVMNALVGSTVTSIQIDVSDSAGNVTTLVFNVL